MFLWTYWDRAKSVVKKNLFLYTNFGKEIKLNINEAHKFEKKKCRIDTYEKKMKELEKTMLI